MAFLFPLRVGILVSLTVAASVAAEVASSNSSASTVSHPGWNFLEFIDRLPGPIAERLSDDQPEGALRLHMRPHYGDLIHRDYLRVPVGAQFKITGDLEVGSEVEGYFTHGLAGAAGYGFSTLRFTSKCDHLLAGLGDRGFSAGVNYQTPLSRPPQDLTDGHRHLQPYVSISHPLDSDWRILGFATLSADFLQHTAMPPHFGRNELHSNSLTFSVGAARDWARFHASLEASVASTVLVSKEGRQLFTLRPEVAFPLRGDQVPTQILLTLGGHAARGPDGNDWGVSSSVRFEFQINGRRRSL